MDTSALMNSYCHPLVFVSLGIFWLMGVLKEITMLCYNLFPAVDACGWISIIQNNSKRSSLDCGTLC